MLKPGATLQRGYLIEKVLGQGGMGAVYLARQANLGDRRVAIKETTIQLDDPAAQAMVREQFQKEAQILASIDHPNLVDVKDYFEENGSSYLVMAFIDGETLEDVLNRSPQGLQIDQVLGWMDQLCDVLIVLHEHAPPVIVRDLKPSNVMVDSAGRVRLIDFGIARIEEGTGAKTSTFLKGAGTVGFAPVEQFGGGGTDQRSDVYALGATIFALLTRTLPPWSMQLATGEAVLQPPSTLNPAISPQLDAVIMRMMAVRRDQRFDNVRAARRALADARGTVREGARAVEIPRRFCTNCGTTIIGTARACTQCGDDLEKQAQGLSGTTGRPAVGPSDTGERGQWGAGTAFRDAGSGGQQWPSSGGQQWPSGGGPSSGGQQWPQGGGPSSGGQQWPQGGGPASGGQQWNQGPSSGGQQWPQGSAPTSGGQQWGGGGPSGGQRGPSSGGQQSGSGPQAVQKPASASGALIAVVVVIVLILGVGGWWMTRPRPSPSGVPVAGPSPAVSPNAAQPASTPVDPQAALKSCESNLKNFGTAAEMWSSDHKGQYPANLTELTPSYLKTLPTCPAAQDMSYSYERNKAGTIYTAQCGGWHHKAAHIARWYPQYGSKYGLRERNPILDTTPSTAQQYGDRGIALYNLGDYDKALSDLAQAHRLSPRWSYPLYYSGLTHDALKQHQQAIDDLTRAIGLFYKDPDYFKARARVYGELYDNENALRDYISAYKLDKNDLDTYASVAFTLYKMGRFKESVEICDTILKRDLKNEDAYVARYWCELCEGKGAAAAADAQSFLTNVGWKSYQSPYSVIVGYFAYMLEHRDSEAKGLVDSGLSRLKQEWPYPCVQYLAGQMTADQMLALATDKEKQTEAHFYVGMKSYLDGKKDEARKQFEWVRDNGHKPYFEYRAALSWLAKP